MARSASKSVAVVPFHYAGQEIRWGGTISDPWFVAQDVCNILGIKNPSDAVSEFASDEKGIETIYTLRGKQRATVVYEPGLYRLIFKSNKAGAELFRRWVFHEVLPSIRKKGEYRSKQREKYAKLGYSEQWVEQREHGIEVRKSFTDTLQDHGIEKGFDYAICTNAIYKPLLGGTATEVKKARQLPVKANVRDNLSIKEIVQVTLAEIVAQETIDGEDRRGLTPCFNACRDASTAIAQATNTTKKIK